MPATDDEIREKYLERAIRELNHVHPRPAGLRPLPARQPDAGARLRPPAGRRASCSSTRPTPAEIEEGVAFYGRAGTALMKSLRRLDIDPLAVYGTLCVKCPVADTSLAAPECLARLVEEIAIVQPKIVVVMGAEALDTLNELALPLAREVEDRPGRDPDAHAVDRGARTCRTSTTALDEEDAKRAFWTRLPRARRLVGGLPAVLR